MKPNFNSSSTSAYDADDTTANDMNGNAANATPFNGDSSDRSKANSSEERPSPPRMYSPEVYDMEVDGMEVGGGSDEESSHEEQQHGTKRARSENESIEEYKEPLSSTEPITKKRRTQEPDATDKTLTASKPMQADQNSGVRMLVNWTCEHLLEMNQSLPFKVGDTFSSNTFAHFSNALLQATKANAPELVQKLLETGMQNCVTEVLDQALTLAKSVGAHDVIALLSLNSSSSSSSSSTDTLSNTCPPEKDWQKKIIFESDKEKVLHIINALSEDKNSTRACTLLFGDNTENWPKGEFEGLTFYFINKDISTLLKQCGAVHLQGYDTQLVLFSSDFEHDMLRTGLLKIQQQELNLLPNQDNHDEENSPTTALIFAALWGDLETVQLLLQNGANPAATDNENRNALMMAASKGYFKIVSLMLEYPINIHARDNNLHTALSYAIEVGSVAICELLIHHGVNLANEIRPPLNSAAKNGCIEIYKYLIKNGAKTNVVNYEGASPLSMAAAGGHLDACKLLVSAGADIKHLTVHGSSILDFAVRSGNPELVEYLFNIGLTLGDSDKNYPPITIAASCQHIAIVKILLAHGAEINQTNQMGFTALIQSCKINSLELTTLLLQAGADPNIADKDQRTPLVYAATNNAVEIIKLLLGYRAKLFTDKHYGWHALLQAVAGGHLEVATYLLEKKVPIKTHTNLINLSFNTKGNEDNHIRMLQLLLRYGASILGPDFQGNDALMLAVKEKKLKVMSFLLNMGAKVGQLNNLNQNALLIATDELSASLLCDLRQAAVNAEILVRLLVRAQTQPNWLDLRKQAIHEEQPPITREIIMLSPAWPLVLAQKDIDIPNLKVTDLVGFDNFIQFAVTASPDILFSKKIDYMLSLKGFGPAIIKLIQPYILALPQLKSQLFGNSLTINPKICESFRVGMFAAFEKIRVEHGGNWKPYKDDLSEFVIFNVLTETAKLELNGLIDFNIHQEATITGIVFEKLFDTCFNFTVAAPVMFSKYILPYSFPAYTAATGALADALMSQGVYSALSKKIEAAWITAWSEFSGTKIINDPGNSSSSSSSSVESKTPSAAFNSSNSLNLSDDVLPSDWIEALPEPPYLFFSLDSAQGQAMLQAFRQQLRLAVDQVGGKILDLPTATAEEEKIYAELMFRQLHMLKQFIDAEEPK